MALMLGADGTFWGLEWTMDLLHGRTWDITGRFARITMCDLAVRMLRHFMYVSNIPMPLSAHTLYMYSVDERIGANGADAYDSVLSENESLQ